MKALYFILVFTILNTCVYAQTTQDSITIKLEKLYGQSSINGFGVAIYSKDKVLYENGFGYSDSENKLPYTVNTQQKIASISKTLLGVSLIKARALGMLELDDDVNDYLPFPLINPYFPNSKITIQHLATHTSGLKKSKHDMDALFFPTPIEPIYKEMPFGIKRMLYKKMIKSLNDNPKISMTNFLSKIYAPNGEWYKKRNFEKNEPGTIRIYSNNGAALLALVIEKASGIKYSEFVRKNILEPLDMTNTRFDFELSGTGLSGQASLYHAGFKMPNDYQLITYPAGGLLSSIKDFSKYMIAMVKGYNEGNSLLSHDDYLSMMGTHLNPKFHQGILWQVHEKSIGHNGDIAGVTTYSYFNKTEGMGYLLFCNTAEVDGMYRNTKEIIKILESSFERFN